MSRQRPNFVQRFVPDINRLFVFPNSMMSPHQQGANGSMDPHTLSYEGNNLNDLTRRQMIEDIEAYRYDLDFCRNQLAAPDLTAQETRTLQIRVLDCGHNIRHCQHRIQLIEAQEARRAAVSVAAPTAGNHRQHRISNAPSVSVKRRLSAVDSDDDDDGKADISLDGPGTNNVQRLGFWKCRLCVSRKFLDAGTNRVPSAPCKWPLKDVSKILNHYLDMHTEHAVEERCAELGAALAHNRGPFEYWLTRTRGQDLSEDSSVIDTYIDILQSGSLPEPLRGLSRAAAKFPPTAVGM
ncbi:uncharacterized protein GGS22DRAFT_117520 [Annulohypoxylon maeteangense]|uniref:uncharacterized protein n=1 Tax=Annulohypoxylon maeteangense TaxID=1927788 RepID=UPI002008CA0D|nr:uncharacterized protein GGS22DRAFT_117520 [Annulohypoxylon maeteangense]KAI0886782.1 hypothetical protein GGS22DRAFT_117520 [Annulohypoxylon maeteangense]